MSISIKRIKYRNNKKLTRALKLAASMGVKLSDYMRLLDSKRVVDDYSRRLKKRKGKTFTNWLEIDVFTPDNAFVPVYPKGDTKNGMLRLISLYDMINEVDHETFMIIEATLLDKAAKESEHEFKRVKLFFDSKPIRE